MLESLEYFTTETGWSFALLLFFGAAGLGPLLLFENSFRFPALASPLAGLLLVNTLTLPIYFVFYVSYSTAALCAVGVTVAASTVLCAIYWKNLRVADTAISAALYRVPKIVTLGRFPGGSESDSRWRTKEARHVGSDTLTPGF